MQLLRKIPCSSVHRSSQTIIRPYNMTRVASAHSNSAALHYTTPGDVPGDVLKLIEVPVEACGPKDIVVQFLLVCMQIWVLELCCWCLLCSMLCSTVAAYQTIIAALASDCLLGSTSGACAQTQGLFDSHCANGLNNRTTSGLSCSLVLHTAFIQNAVTVDHNEFASHGILAHATSCAHSLQSTQVMSTQSKASTLSSPRMAFQAMRELDEWWSVDQR